MVRRIGAIALALLLAAGPAFAADNMTVKDSTGATVTVRSKDTGSAVQAPTHTVADSSGTIIDPATAANQATANTSLATIATTLTANAASPVTESGSWNVGISGTLPAFAATPAVGSQGSVTTSAPTYTNSTMNYLSLTTAGGLRVDGSGITQPVSGTFWQTTQPVSLATLPAFGSTPTFNCGTGCGGGGSTAQAATTSGVTGGLAFGMITTAAPTYTTGQVNGLSLTTAGGLRVDGSGVTQPVSASSLPLPTGAATAANQLAPITQGSTTSGQSGALVMGSVTTTAPTYTNSQSSPLNLDTHGSMAVTIRDSTGAAVDFTAASAVTQSGTWAINANLTPSASATYAVTRTPSASSSATSLVAKASAGNIYGYGCQATAAGRCILYNGTAAPSTGALTAANVLGCQVVAAGGQGAEFFTMPRRMTTGVVVIYSSSADCNTYTSSTTAYIYADWQ